MAYYSNALYLYGVDTGKSINCLYKFDLNSEIWSVASYSTLKNILTFHQSYTYLDYLYIFFGVDTYSTIPYSFIQSYSFKDDSWTAQNFSSDFRVSFSSVKYSNFVYILFGQSDTLTQNSILQFTLGDAIQKKVLIDSADFPKKRKNHASFVFDSEFYIFAGISENGEYLNDMWKFNFDSLAWTKVKLTGSIPSGRELISLTKIDGLGVAITSGRNGDEVFSDLYYFESKNNNFLLMEEKGDWKTPRYSSCFVIFNALFVEIGGRDFYSMASDVFLFDFLNSKNHLIDVPDWFQLINHFCIISGYGADYFVVTVIGGTSIEEVPNYSIYDVKISGVLTSNFSISITTRTTSRYLRTSDTAFIISDTKVYMIGGSIWSEYLNSEIVCYDISNNNFSSVSLPSNLYLSGHSAAHFKDQIYVFGGTRGFNSFKTFESYSNTLYNITFESDDTVQISCSTGTIGEFCTPCQAGTYYYYGVCSPCKKGTFSSAVGAAGNLECIPCDSGYYSDSEGSTYCKKCPYGYYCPISTSEPLIVLGSYKENSSQPLNYESDSSNITTFQDNLWYIFFGSSFTFILLLLVSRSFRNLLKYFDYYHDSHSQPLNAPIMYRKTRIGGLFFLLFIIIASLTFIASLLIYYYNNVTENKTLVPMITLDEEVVAKSIEVQFTLLGYGGECMSGSSCYEEILISYTGFTYDSLTYNCSELGLSCIVKLQYKKVQIQKDSEITLNCNDISASATGILVSISSTSSIPSQLSSSSVPIFPDDDSLLFRGQTPTTIKYELIPSVISI